jgi:hypothetical protein
VRIYEKHSRSDAGPGHRLVVEETISGNIKIMQSTPLHDEAVFIDPAEWDAIDRAVRNAIKRKEAKK